jgi:G3E family GTPase
LLNQLLAGPALKDCAVLINEFGETAIDHLLVRRLSEEMVVLDSGCLCCAVLGDMVTTLRDLFRKRVMGEVPEFGRVVIETSGLADPAPIIHTLMSDVFLSARYRLDGVICTVDAVNGAASLDRQRESVKQAAMADRLLLTKTDLADAGTVAALRQRLAALNPTARQMTSVMGAVDAAELLDCGLWDASGRIADVAGWLNDEALAATGHHHHDHDHDHDHDDDHHHHHDRHDAHVSSFVLVFEQPLSWEPLALALEVLMSMRGENLLRVKGIVNVVERIAAAASSSSLAISPARPSSNCSSRRSARRRLCRPSLPAEPISSSLHRDRAPWRVTMDATIPSGDLSWISANLRTSAIVEFSPPRRSDSACRAALWSRPLPWATTAPA